MERVSDFLRYKEKIKSTLHCEDKEKLRKKLALLQKEYLRTAQRLQRAERLDAARKHVRSKISDQQFQKERDVSSRLHPIDCTVTSDTSNDAQGPQCHTGTSAAEKSKPLIRFQLPTDASCPSMPDNDQDTTHGYRSSPSLRLRSRSSRLRLEKRIAESSGSTCNSQEGQNQTEENDTEPVKEGDELQIVNESEDLILDSQSLLLPHWNTQGERVDVVKKEGQIQEDLHDQRELLNSSHIISEAQNEGGREGSSHVEETMDERVKDENVQQTNSEAKQEPSGMGKEKGASLLDSYTLVEGLLFPAEYYIRTTRRMSLSQSQPDMQAVILSQLSVGRPRRGRRAKGSNVPMATKNTQTESSLIVNKPDKDLQVAETSTKLSGKTPDSREVKVDRSSSPSVHNSKRGNIKRGRARGKPSRCTPQRNMPQRDLDQSSSSNLSSSVSSTHGPNTLSPVIVSQEVALDDIPSPSAVTEAQPRHTEKVYPMFLRSSSQTSTSADVENLQPLLLPSTPPLLPLPSLLTHTLINNMENLDLQNDFYLPDEQFASLKLQKLKQVTLGLAVEDFLSPSSNASSSSHVHLSDPKSPLPPPGTLTSTVNIGPQLPDNKCEKMNTTFGECIVQSDTGSTEVLKDLDSDQDDEQVNRSMDLLNSPAEVMKRTEAASDCSLTNLHSHVSLNLQYETKHADLEQKDLLGPSQSSKGEPPKQTSSAKSPKPLKNVNTQLLLSPTLASAHQPQLPAPNSSPILPSLGFTPLCDSPPAPLSSSPAAPMLTLPPSHSPSTLALSPPLLSPSCSPSAQISSPVQITIEPQSGEARLHTSNNNSKPRESDQEENKTLTLKAPAGAPLVDVCCPVMSSGQIHVAAAGKWAVFLWSVTSHTDWTPTHTWTFTEPVNNVFPVLDSDGLMCVTLGELEIREVRLLSCPRLTDIPLCVGLVDTMVAAPESRVVTSCPSSFGSTLQVFTLSDRSQRSETLASPGVCVQALAAVDGLSDALIGSDEAEHLFIWNLRTGQLLRRILLGDGLSPAACLRGYSEKGLLFVLLQHHYLSCVERDEEQKNVLFSLFAVNPLSGKSALVSSLYPPKSWFGRLCNAEVSGSRVVGLSQSGCVCVWELQPQQAAARTVTSPGLDSGWSLARWGGNTLITAQRSGDVTLHLSL